LLRAASISFMRLTARRDGASLPKKTSAQCDQLLTELVGLIHRHATFGLVVIAAEKEFADLIPTEWKTVPGARLYAVCLQYAQMKIGEWIRKNAPGNQVAYIFESGHKDMGTAGAAMTRAALDQKLKEQSCYKSHAFVAKRDASPLQAADLLAWEMNKLLSEKNRAGGRAIKPRKSLLALSRLKSQAYWLKGPRLAALVADMIRYAAQETRRR